VRVLVVDGSAEVGVRVAERLREAEHEVVGLAMTARAACEQALALAPEAIVVDPQLPDRSGPDVIAELRQRAPAALLVVLSSDPQPRYRRSCEAQGAAYFFDKASEFEALPAALARRSGV
jgi:DNA-binding NarL/FixJ family response regulator